MLFLSIVKRKIKHPFRVPYSLVGVEGIGPSTSVLSGQRSTTELHARYKNNNKKIPTSQRVKRLKYKKIGHLMSCWEETLDGHPWGGSDNAGALYMNVQKGQWRGKKGNSF